MADTKDKKESSENLPIKAHTFGKLTFRVFLIALVLGGGYAFWKNPNLSNDVSAKVKSFFESSNSESEMPQIDQVALLRQEVNDLRTQIALMQSLQAQKQDTAALEKRFETLEKFNQNVIDSKADVSIVLGLLTRLDKVEQQLDVLSKITDQGAVILTATMMVKDAAERGGSFIYEAEVLNQLATDNTQIKPALDVIQKAAVDGIVNDAYLIKSFDDVYSTLLKQARQESEKTWKDRLNSKISEYIKIQKNGEKIPLNQNLQDLDNVKILVNSGNIKKAVVMLSQLSSANLQKEPLLKAWLEKAQAKIAFDEAISQIATYYLAALKVNFIKKETQHD